MSGGWVQSLGGVGVVCPPGWSAAADVGGVGVELVRRDGGCGEAMAAVRAVAEPVAAGTTLDAYAERQMTLLRSEAEALRLLDEEPAELCGAPAWRVLVAFRSGLAHLTGDQWWAVAGERAVVVACACLSPLFPRHEATFGAVAGAVRLNPP